MRATLMSLVFVFFLFASVIAQEPTPSERPLAFTHVTVIDATGAPAQPDMTVVVSGNRITALGKFGRVAIPKDALVTNANNRFMIPGLWEMHQHPFMRKNRVLPLLALNLHIANGVTGIRDIGDQGVPDDFGDFPYHQDFLWRQAITAGAVVGPRLVLSSVIIDGPKGPRPSWAAVSTAAEARQRVIALKKQGADFVKVHDRVPREAYFAIVDEAKKQGLPVAGHVPFALSAAEVSDAGQRSIEHLSGILIACSSKENELIKATIENGGKAPDLNVLLETYDEDKAMRLFAKFAKNGTYSVPTLVIGHQRVQPIPLTDPHITKYLSTPMQNDYKGGWLNINPASIPARRAEYQANQRMVAAMQRAGVKTMTGTDTWWSFGFSLHEELVELVKAGLTPMEAVQAATRNPAEYLGQLGSMGTIEKGKLADLVLLDANPLEAIENTQKIQAVIVNGRLLDRKALDRMLAQVEAATKN